MKALLFCLLVVSVVRAQTADLFFSEYVEGSSDNKALEIYNGTGFDVDLSTYTVERYTNGSPTVSSDLTLEGILADGDVYIIANSAAVQAILDETDLTSGLAIFNGDDAIALRKNDTLIDLIGVIGEDPGDEWGEDLLSTADNTLRRKSTICSGNTTFNLANEWDGFETDTFDGLGSHTADCGSVEVTAIYDIQFTTNTNGDSPFNNQADITTEGIVTALFTGGYFIQDEVGAWKGLWISDAMNVPVVGDRVRITGMVAETNSMTELHTITEFYTLSSGNTLPSPELLSTGNVADEQWEGVLVQVENALVTSTDVGNGTWAVDDGSGLAHVGTRGSYTYSPVVDDEFDFILGPVESTADEFTIQPRDDNDLKVHIELSLVINEIHADPDAEFGDANGDGTVDTDDDEFVEIVNASDAAVDLSGWTLSDASSVRHIFPEGTVLQAHSAIVIFDGGTPTGDFGGAIVQVASEGLLSLNNTDDTIILNDGTTDVLVVAYEGADQNQSITRDPDLIGEIFVQHSEASNANGALFSPGTFNAGYCFHATLIHDVQGHNSNSPLDGNSDVVVEGIVVADFQSETELKGFFLQEETAQHDEHTTTSEGVFVYDNNFGVDVNVGDMVRVTGSVREFYDRTELSDLTELLVLRQATLPDATVVSLPAGDEDLENYEGMLITINQEMTVSGHHNLAAYGEVELSVNGRLYTPTNCVSPGEDTIARQNENDNLRIQLDDGSRVENPDPTPYLIDSTLRLGSTLPTVVGVLDYSFNCFEIHPTQAVQFQNTNARTEPASMNSSFKAVSFNLRNFFNGDGQSGGFPTSRGAETYDDYLIQRQKLISALAAIDADLFGLNELENDGYGEYSAIQDLVNGLNDATAANTFDFINPGTNQIGTDEVTSGIIYKPAMLTPIGVLAILDENVDELFDLTNRPSLAQTFQDTSGEYFTFVVNHFRSRSSACPDDEDQGDGQGHCNQTRVNAATALVNWLATDPTSSNDSDILIVGDLNAYPTEDPITVLTTAGYINLVDDNIGDTAYTYVYDAQAGYIDHAFVSPSLHTQITGLDIWHINADEPFDVNVENGGIAVQGDDDPYRSSDHDPVIIGFELEPISIEMSLFKADFIEDQVTIEWQTESEINIAGFHVLRSSSKDGIFEKINQDLIVSLGDSGRGAVYEYVDPDGLPSVFYKLEIISLDGQSEYYGPIEVVDTGVDAHVLPTAFALYENYPNPFNPSTVIRYDVPHPEHVTIRIYDINGRYVCTLLEKETQAGSFEATWNGTNDHGHAVAAGLYFYELCAGDFMDVHKMMLIK